MSNSPTNELETTRTLARRLNCSTRTIPRWVAAGILSPPIKINGRNFYRAGLMPRPDAPRSKRPIAAAPRQEVTS